MPSPKLEETHRLTVRFKEDDYERLKYWAEQGGYSINELIVVMLDRYISIENGDYRIPTLEQQRLNQLIESEAVLAKNIRTLEQTVIAGFDSLLGMTRGDNYLLEEDGEV